MKSPTINSLTNGFPLVIPTQTQQPTARLLLRNTHGQVLQQWLVKQNKCTLGSAASCSLRCQLPGVAPYHALLVIGARQIFIRGLAPKLTRDGRPFNELLLTDDDSHFELAGHRFELTRNNEELRGAARSENSSPERIKFTLARPFELRNRPQASQPPFANENESNAEPLAASMPAADSKWVAQLIQAAMQPLECQLHNLIEPLSELQNESRKLRRLRKKRALRKRNSRQNKPSTTEDHLLQTVSQQFAERVEEIVDKQTSSMQMISPQFAQRVEEIVGNHTASIHTLTPQLAQQVEEIVGRHAAAMQMVSPQFAQQVEEIVGKHAASIQTVAPQFAQQVEELVSKQSTSMEVLAERVSDVNQQLSTIERLIADERAQSQEQAATPVDNSQFVLQSTAIDQLQHDILTVSSALENLRAQHTEARQDDQQWKSILQSQLQGLTQVIDGLSSSVAEVHQATLRVATQPAPVQPTSLNEVWPAREETAFDENLAADPVALDRSCDSPLPDELNITSEVSECSTAASDEDFAEEFTEADGFGETAGFHESDSFDEFSQLRTPPSSSTAAAQASLPDEPEPSSTFHQYEVVESKLAKCEAVAKEYAASSYTKIEVFTNDVFADDVARNGPAISEIAISEIAESEVAESEVAESEVAESEVAESEVAESEVAESEVAESEVAESEVVNDDGVIREVAAIQQPMGQIPEPALNSLPSWWMDQEESDRDSVCVSGVQPSIDSAIDYDSGFELSEPVAQAVDSGAMAKDLSNDEQPSEEFYGLAQLGLEEHLREAAPLPHGVVPNPQVIIAEETIAEPEADDELIGFGESYSSHPNAAATGGVALESESAMPPETIAEMPIFDEVDVAADEQALASPSGPTLADSQEAEDDSVEEYMRKLLARMRGVPEDEVELPKSVAGAAAHRPTTSAAPAAAAHPRAHIERPLPAQETESEAPVTTSPATQPVSAEVTEPFDPEKYMPRALAPERSKSLAAMRELANSSARTAIHRSTRKRHVSSILLKSVIAVVGLVVGMVLVAINGVNMNIGLFATIAAFLVAAVWGYDSISSIRPMLQNGLVLTPQAGSPGKRSTCEEDE